MKEKIKIAIIGVGNCASSLIQGIEYYKMHATQGVMRDNIGGYTTSDIQVVAAFDIDERKVGLPLHKAIYSKPNCTINIMNPTEMPELNVVVQMGHLYDGVSDHMKDYPENDTFKIAVDKIPVNIVQILKDTKADILINYLPVGSQIATEFYANCAIEANVAFLNCIPVFIASNKEWEQKFIDAGLPLIGDDMKSQFGASILSQMLQELAFSRGHKVNCHIQENVGGNTDFLNMVNQSRLKSKKISKENVIRSQNDIRGIGTDDTFLYAGPSNYIRYYGDNKICTIHLELEGFGTSPVVFDCRMSVQDSPNSAGVVIDAIRYLKVAREMGIVGSLHGASAFTQKTPPYPMTFQDAEHECELLADRKYSKLTIEQLLKTEHATLTNAPDEIIQWYRFPYQYFTEVYHHTSSDTLLDIGCGDNFQLPLLTNEFKEVISMDYKPINDSIQCGDILNIPLADKSVDVVYAFEVLQSIKSEDIDKALSELKRVARKYIVIGSISKNGPRYLGNIPIFKNELNQYNINEYSIEEWKELFKDEVLYHSIYNDGDWSMELGVSNEGISNYTVIKL